MYLPGHASDSLSQADISLIHQAALRILAEMGMQIQNDSLLKACAAVGLNVDFTTQRVRFPPVYVEKFIAGAEKHDWAAHVPTVTATAGMYHGKYHDPLTNTLVDWTEERMAFYFGLARSLEHVGTASMLGCRLPVAPQLEALYERFYNWKYGGSEGGSINLDETCPHLLELYRVRAAQLGKPLAEVFEATVYLVPPLKLGAHEAYQVAYFWKKGLHVGIGDMYAMGANCPVTLAGAVTLNLAEQLALQMFENVLWGGKPHLHLHCSLAPMDMRTMIYPFGRPESIAAGLLTAQLARFYGASFSGHAGLTSAKLPSPEAGYQKAASASAILMAGGSLWMDAGLLAIDEVYSPIQMVLDNEFLGSLKHLTGDIQVDEDSIGLDAIFEAGPGGSFVGLEHTARHMRKALWQPGLWSRSMLGPWQEAGRLLDVDIARQKVLDFQAGFTPPAVDQAAEKEWLAVIASAAKSLSNQL